MEQERSTTSFDVEEAPGWGIGDVDWRTVFSLAMSNPPFALHFYIITKPEDLRHFRPQIVAWLHQSGKVNNEGLGVWELAGCAGSESLRCVVILTSAKVSD